MQTLTKAYRMFLHPGSPAAVYRQPRSLAYAVAARVLNSGLRGSARLGLRGAAHCIVCGWTGARFGYAVAITKARLGRNELCLGCGSNPRTRALLEVLARHVDLTAGDLDVVDVGAAPCTRRYFERLPRVRYRVVDRYKEADVYSDVTAIALPDASVDVVLCCHVLEHIEDYAKAIAELYRIVKPGGCGIIAVPQTRGLAVTRRTGQPCLDGYGHVWEMGDDFPQALSRAGFEVRPVEANFVETAPEAGQAKRATLPFHWVSRPSSA